MQILPALGRLAARVSVGSILLVGFAAHAETYWLDSRYDDSQVHYPTGEEACLSGELQRRLDGYRATSTSQHRLASPTVGPDAGIGERICRGIIQRNQFNLWLPVETVDTVVYGPLGATPPCPLGGLADPDTGQCGVPKCDHGCPADGGNQSNPIASATGNKRQVERDYQAAGVFPLEFVRYYNSHRVADNQALPIGTGWSHSYSARLVAVPNGGSSITRIRAYRPGGAIQAFNLLGGSWVGDADVPERLTATLSNGVLASATYRRADDTVEAYDQFGRLTSITTREGFVQTLSYAAGAGNSPNVQRVTDPQGRSLVFGYTSGRLTSITDSAGNVISYGYSGDDLTSVNYPNGTAGPAVRTYHYNETGQTGGLSQPHVLTGITDESGHRYASWGYDANRRGVLSVHGPYATGTADRVALQFNADGSSTITDSLGKSRTYGFSVSHGVARLATLDAPCDRCGNAAATHSYDANGFPASETDFEGNLTQHTYNARGLEAQRIEAATDTDGNKRTVQTDWHATFRQPTENRVYDAANVLVLRTTLTYNSRGQPLTQTRTDPVAGVSRIQSVTYCESAGVSGGTCPLVGLAIQADGPRTDVTDQTSYTYYQADHSTCAASPATCPYRKGDLWKVTDATGQITEYLRHDGMARPLSVKDPNGVVTDFEYHPRGWLLATKVRGANNSIEADDRITRIDYWPTGLVKRLTQPSGEFLDFGYDSAQRLVRLTDSDGGYIAYTLDNAGNRVAEETRDAGNILRRSLTRIYDLLGRLETVADASSNPTDFIHDDNGNPTTVTDPLGRVATQQYDARNRVRRTLQDVGGIAAQTQFGYDALDQLVQVIDPKGLATGYTRNALGDLLQLSSPDTGVTGYSYDSAGNRSGQLDARGQASTYVYDALNRLAAITYAGAPGLDITYQYDMPAAACIAGETFAAGRLSSVLDANGSTHYCHDRFGQVVRKVQQANGVALVNRYAYNASGKLQATTYPDGTVVDYVRDPQGHISEIGVTAPGAAREVLLTGAAYYPFGPPAGWSYGNGRTLARVHDQDYRASSLHDVDADGLDLGYRYDPTGNLAGLHTADHALPPKATFDYDALNRLTAFRDGPSATAIESYTYDATGNRASFTNAGGSQAYVYDTNSHRVASVAGVARAYDAAGNTTAVGPAREFVYDARNRLSQVKTGGAVAREYAYNGRGERVRNFLGASSVYSIYDEAGHWLGDYDTAGAPLQQVIWMDDLPVGVLVGAAGTSNRLHYIEPDHLGTPRAVIEVGRNVAVWTWDLKGEAFGNSAPNQDPDADGMGFVFDMRFPGQRYDVASGLNYNYFRDYEPSSGRYVESDPIGLAAGVNTYAYVGGNPLSLIDPLGLAGCYVSWPGYPITIPGTTRSIPLVHAGVLSYDSAGSTRYYEYGRYGSDFGSVRRQQVPDLTMGPDGKPTPESWDKLMKALDKFGKGQKTKTSCDDKADADKINAFAEQRMNDPNRAPYSWNPLSPNTCTTFAQDALGAGQ